MMRNSVLLLIATAAFFFCLDTTAATYYVSPAGDDTAGNGSAASPWKTLKFAVTSVAPNQGHTIQLTAGIFIESGQVEIPPGINITGAGKGLTILKAASPFYYHPPSPGYATDKFLLSLKASNQINGNQTLRGFTIDGDSKQLHGGIYIRYRSNVIIRSVKIENTNFTGIWFWDVKDTKLLDTDLINCSWGSTGYCVGALNLGNIERMEIDHLNVDENTGYGIKAIGPDGYNDIHYLRIHDSRISVHPRGLWNNGTAPNIAIELWQVDLAGCEIDNTYVDNTISLVNSNANPSTGNQTIRVHHNIIDIETRAQGAGYGIELTIHDAEVDHNYFLKGRYGIANWSNPMKNWNIHHNVFYAQEGVYPGDIVRSQWSGLHNVDFHNNTIEFTGNKTMNIIGLYGGTTENLSIINNLFINNNTGYSYYPNALVHMENGSTVTGLSVKNNLFDRLPIGNISGVYAGNITGDPKICKTGGRPEYYTPLAESPLIDKGLSIAWSFLGLAPDIGAYEYNFDLINLKPQVSLVQPVNNSTVAAGSSIVLAADASDTDGSILKVEFFSGTTKIGDDFNSPYTIEWSTAAAGTYSLTAKATDTQGAAATSGAIAVTIAGGNQLPSVTLTNPADDTGYPVGASLTLAAAASDPDGSIAKVEFFRGTVKLGEDLSDPYAFHWGNLPQGTYSLTAKATDNLGGVTVSTPVSINVEEVFIHVDLYAPDAQLGGSMKLTNDSTTSKGSYFAVPLGMGTNHHIPPSAYAQFYLNLEKEDRYYVWARIRSAASNKQGYHVYDGKGNWTSWLAGVHPEWTWVKVTNAYTRQVATFPFTAGFNILRMSWFHEDAHIDRVHITNDANYIPSDKSQPSARTNTPETDTTVQEEHAAAFELYPNPVKDRMTISYTSESAQEARISIKNATSLDDIKMNVSLVPGPNSFEVDMKGQRAGLYVISIISADGTMTLKKVVVGD